MKSDDLIIRLSNQRGGLNPEAIEILSLDFKSPLYHLDYKLRHPFGIYRVSLNRIISKFKNVLYERAKIEQSFCISQNDDPNWDTNLLDHEQGLLYALMEHMDDCENVLKCFYKRGTKLNQDKNYQNYISAVNPYRTHIGKVVNQLKHNQGRLRSFGMVDDDNIQFGYFVEGIAKDGSLGPDPIIHNNGSTAFSYARDIRYHLYNLYFVSHKLSQALEDVSKPDKNKVILQIESNTLNLEKVLSGIVDLPLVVFPDEFKKNFPLLTIDHFEKYIEMTLYRDKRPIGLRTGDLPIKFVSFYEGDGVSNSFRLPYKRK